MSLPRDSCTSLLMLLFEIYLKGDEGFAEHVDRMFDCAEYFTEKLKKSAGFELLFEVLFSISIIYVIHM